MHTRFTVGEVAKLTGLSKQTLIYYDREGVFVPRLSTPRTAIATIRQSSLKCWTAS